MREWVGGGCEGVGGGWVSEWVAGFLWGGGGGGGGGSLVPRPSRETGPGDTWQNSRMCSVSIVA